MILRNLAGGRIRMIAWAFLALLLITVGLYPSIASTSAIPEDFQATLDALQKVFIAD